MSVRVGINGMGRIGRTFFRHAWDRPGIEIAAVNDVAEPRILAHLLRHDSVAGRWNVPVESGEGSVVVGGRAIPCTAVRSPAEIPWGSSKVRFVVEATGLFRERRAAEGHLRSGVERVIISAPSPDPDLTVVMGVNHQDFDPQHHRILSNASCTTNCAAPLLMLVDREFGIEACSMTTIHCYTNDQPLMDAPHRDPRRARAAAVSMIPTSTSASGALESVLPNLKGKIASLAVRVPTAQVSAVDLVAALSRDADLEAVRSLLRVGAGSPLAGIVGFTEEELVSIDYRGDSRSAVVDASLLALPSPRLLKIYAWYDNETGYSHRLLDLIRLLAARVGEGR